MLRKMSGTERKSIYSINYYVLSFFKTYTKYHTMKMCGGVEGELHTFLTSALDGDE
jgi:hypothetical protein